MSAILRSARPAVRRTTVTLVSRVAVVPARRLATDAKQHNKQQHDQQHNQQKQASQQQQQQQQQQQPESQEGNIWATPLKTPLKAAAGEVLTDVVGAAASMKDSVKAKITNSSATEQVREKAHELGAKARAAASSASEQLGDIIDPKGAGKDQSNKRAFSTSSSRSAARDSERAAKDLQDDATRMKQKVQNRSAQAGIEMKEQGQSMMHGVKKTARAVGAAVTDAIDSATSAVTGGEKRDATNDPELSTSKRPGNVVGGSTDSNLGEGQESVKKSFLDGPQVMPQGVGKRAKDDEGKPMEQGSPRT